MEPGQGRQFAKLYLEQSRDIVSPIARCWCSEKHKNVLGNGWFPSSLWDGVQLGIAAFLHAEEDHAPQLQKLACLFPRALMGRRDACPTKNWHLQPHREHLPCENYFNSPKLQLPWTPFGRNPPAWHQELQERVWELQGWQIILWRFLGSWSTGMTLQSLQKAAIYKKNSKSTVHFKY